MHLERWLQATVLVGLVGGGAGCVYSLAVAGTAAGILLARRLASANTAN